MEENDGISVADREVQRISGKGKVQGSPDSSGIRKSQFGQSTIA